MSIDYSNPCNPFTGDSCTIDGCAKGTILAPMESVSWQLDTSTLVGGSGEEMGPEEMGTEEMSPGEMGAAAMSASCIQPLGHLPFSIELSSGMTANVDHILTIYAWDSNGDLESASTTVRYDNDSLELPRVDSEIQSGPTGGRALPRVGMRIDAPTPCHVGDLIDISLPGDATSAAQALTKVCLTVFIRPSSGPPCRGIVLKNSVLGPLLAITGIRMRPHTAGKYTFQILAWNGVPAGPEDVFRDVPLRPIQVDR